jgi:hypothetical protein
MKPRRFIKTALLLSLLISSINAICQDTNDDDNDNPGKKQSAAGFHVGLYVGTLFPSNYTASMYDGYGFDIDGNKNNFENSFMYQKIVNQYGGGYGGPDQIAQALGVTPYTGWTFNESDMPVNMRYAIAFDVGLNTRYSVKNSKSSIILNVNASKLTINGNFTIVETAQPNTTQVNNTIQTFGIKGGEQRLIFQFGYNRIMGDNENLNFMMEGGLLGTLAKFDKNQILINNLLIDLTTYYYQPGYPSNMTKKPIGFGLGAFAGMGVNLSMNKKCTVQLLYSPTYEKINMGVDPRYKVQNAIGFRAYYNI